MWSPISCGHAHTPNPSPLAKHDATNAFPASFLTPAHTLGWSWPQPGDRAVPQGGPRRLRPTMPVIKYGHDVKFTLLWSFTTWNSRGKGVPYHLMQRPTQYSNFLASNSGLNRFFRQPAASAGCGFCGLKKSKGTGLVPQREADFRACGHACAACAWGWEQ